ncbi:hypothetical protein B9T31_14985 [Acinetobacter sp. ANC 4558]|nr:hypothetical protein B9T31_14985 [Acinetobacter sp. ANC 4558]
MNAVEFFKEWGYDHSKKYVELAQSEGDILPWEVELKRLVNSWRIVQSFGGLSDSKVYSKMGRHYKYLKRAIADVESVGAVA